MDGKNNHTVSQITIIGLGLIGGSVAKACRRAYPSATIIGVDTNRESCRLALEEGVATQVYTQLSEPCLQQIAKSKILLLGTGVDACASMMQQIAPYLKAGNTIVTDVCSTKQQMYNLMVSYGKEIRYIGGHPMAGSEKSGYAAASPFLLENAIYVLSPMPYTEEADLAYLEDVVRHLGALPMVLSAAAHDDAMARISHLPHIVASALVNAAMKQESQEEVLHTLAAGGFKDITRIASSDPDLWTGISFSNRENLLNAISDMMEMLGEYKDALEQEQEQQLQTLFQLGSTRRENFANGIKPFMNLMYELNVDVPDQPGILAEITVKLTREHINIRNIYIAESRESELGCLRLVFDSKETRDKAAGILGVSV